MLDIGLPTRQKKIKGYKNPLLSYEIVLRDARARIGLVIDYLVLLLTVD